MSISQVELKDFEQQADAWFAEHKPSKPTSFCRKPLWRLAPINNLSTCVIGRTKYTKPASGMAWPKEFGGGGRPSVPGHRHKAMATSVPFLPNTIGSELGRAVDSSHGYRGREAKIHKRYFERRRYLVSGFFGARSWLRSWQRPMSRCERRRRIRSEWIEDLTSLGSYAKYMILLHARRPADPTNMPD
ncbi:MAG: hypothetical protein CM15mP120_24240 [Pseudomonadota bacterium]|nr:MAG: hypothetical protein CM15mP120_24240 [Pseudomonadota bacterium]